MAEQYTVKAGDTLWDLYGSNWRELSGYTGDPTKLQIGTKLPMPSTLKYDPTKIGQQILRGGTDLGIPPARGVDTGALMSQIGGMLNLSNEQLSQLSQLFETQQAGQQNTKQPSIWQQLIGQRTKLAEDRPTQETYQGFLEQGGYSGLLEESKSARMELSRLQGEMAEWQKQIQDLEAQKTQRLLAAEDEMAGRLTSALRGEQALIERKYNSEIAAKSAQASVTAMQYEMKATEISLIKEDMSSIENLAKQYMEFALYDYEQKLDDLNYIKDIYGEMTAEENEIWERQFKVEQFEYQKEQDRIANEFRQQGLNLDMVRVFGTDNEGDISGFDDAIMEELALGVSPEEAARNALVFAGAIGLNTDEDIFNRLLKRAETIKKSMSREEIVDFMSGGFSFPKQKIGGVRGLVSNIRKIFEQSQIKKQQTGTDFYQSFYGNLFNF